ncbi:DUF4153 domain-containing protein [Tahibacter amnicola]|uniref:DUF4153 domain-containing protein n=1 Tax=Tahibacter amnicola TaxID=2976241 RepID=A0ABY6BK47_9GAMM|nr:DUF4153 domain-containing protein [Tahibacter amnicola]UXI69847.1 DUF4153 domain-containing protein [Tahibacter amnicola]
MTPADSLPRPERAFIVLTALLQGLLLYLAETGTKQGWWPFAELGGRVCWYTLVLCVPVTMTLSVRDLRQRIFWTQTALVFLVYLLLAVGAAWSATGAPHIDSGNVLGPFGFSIAVALFIALPYLQARLKAGRWCAPYAELFESAWQNGLTVILTGLFVGICWGVLFLWAQLFELIKIHFFEDLFREKPFVYLATGSMVGLGILISRTQAKAVHVARQILFAVFKGLLPLVAAIAVLFIVTLPLTGLEVLWATRSATAILLTLVVVVILFTNAVYQDGGTGRPYPKVVRRVVEAGLATLPVYAMLAIYALTLRIGQYGFSQDRVWGLISAIVLTGYSAGYAYSVFRQRESWLSPLRQTNIVLSLVVIGLVLLTNSPVLDPHRIAVADQVARFVDGRTEAGALDLPHLRFASGRRGYMALEQLLANEKVTADTELKLNVDKSLKSTSRHDYGHGYASEQERKAAVKTAAEARAFLHVAPGTEVPGDWLDQVVAGSQMPECLHPASDCVVLQRDLDGDATAEILMCDLSGNYGEHCELWTRAQARWVPSGSFNWYGSGNSLDRRKALRKGELKPERRRWPDLNLSGERAQISQ